MPELKRALAGDTGHEHIAYLDTTTKAKDHSHGIMVEMDEMGQETPVMEPGPDGHVHELVPIGESDPRADIPKEEEHEVVQDLHDLYVAARRLEQPSRDKGEENWQFYMNNQWDDNDRALLKKRKRACLTINEIKPLVNLVCGFQKQNVTDPTIRPWEASDEDSAEVGNNLLKFALNKNYYEDEKGQVFKDQVIPGRGVFHVRWDPSFGDDGEVRVEHMGWKKPCFGPHLKLDGSDMEYEVLTDMLSKHKINRLYPEKADRINAWIGLMAEDSDGGPHVQPVPGLSFEGASKKKALKVTDDMTEELLIAKKNIKVFELWRKEYRRVPVLIDRRSADVQDLSVLDIKPSEVKSLGALDGVEIEYKHAVDMRVTKVAGAVLLDDEIVAADDFEVFPVYADKYEDDFMGWVESLKDPNREVNKRHSQLTDAASSIGGTRYVKRSAFTPEELRKYLAHGAEWNYVATIEDTGDKMPVVREDQPQIPAIMAQLAQMESETLRDVSNMRDVAGLQGQGASNMSGKALLIQRRNSMVGNNYLFVKLSAAERKVAKRVIRLIQDNYSLERCKRIIQPNQAERQANGQPPISDESIQAFLDNKDFTYYDIVIEEAAHSRSLRDTIFSTMVDMMGQGVTDIDTKDVFEFSSFPQSIKTRIMAGIDARRQAMQQQETQKQQSEQMKSLPDEMKLAQAGMAPSEAGGI